MSADPDYGECYRCGCEGMAMTYRQFAHLRPLELTMFTAVFTLPDGKAICGECYDECRTELLEKAFAAEAMLAWEQDQINPQPPGKGALDSLSAQMQNCEKYFQ